uniref:glutathione transferase n=1 Tax=Elaeis guineensis var. tenera TaxID=51953 RepID=A0A6I9R7H0_ELAGV|nr:glutathione S-transferase 3 [Elaeis guineensis]
MGMKLYGTPLSTNATRVRSLLNEKGIDFELVPVNLRAGDHKRPPFLALNPFGQVPVLQDGDIILFESRAINRYIASRYKETGPDLLRSAAGPAETAAVEVWLAVESQQFGPPIEELVFEVLIKPLIGETTDQTAVEREAERLGRVLDVYEERLSKNKYLAGGEFTLADLNHMTYTYFLLRTPQADLVTSRSHVLAWWEDISSRPAWKKTAEIIPV